MTNHKNLYRGFHPDSPYQTLQGEHKIEINGTIVYGEWVYGYLANSNTINEYTATEIDGKKVEIFEQAWRVIPETVGQCITTDKNGKDVFEGDIDKDGFEIQYVKGFDAWVAVKEHGSRLLYLVNDWESVSNKWEVTKL